MVKNKKKGRDCKVSLSDRCLQRSSAKCVDYEGELSEHTELDSESCHNVEDVIEDINNIIDDIKDAIDVTGLGCCLDYEAEDEEVGLTVRDVLVTHEGVLCDFEERITELEKGGGNSSNCGSVNECGEPTNGCDIFEYSNFGIGSQVIDSRSFQTFKAISSIAYNGLQYKFKKRGKYKVTVEIDANTDTNGLAVGISSNNQEPETNPFSQIALRGQLHHSITFLVDAKKNDDLKLKFKLLEGTVDLNFVKILIEKIG